MLMQEKLWLEKHETEEAFKKLIGALRPTCWGTFVTNQFLPLTVGRRMLTEFHVQAEQRILGKYFYRYPERRILSICFPEHIDGELHYHAPMYVAPELLPKFSVYAPSIWKQICPSGDGLFCKLKSSDDVFGTGKYSIKDTWRIENYENFIVSTEGWNPKTRITCGAPSMEYNRRR